VDEVGTRPHIGSREGSVVGGDGRGVQKAEGSPRSCALYRDAETGDGLAVFVDDSTGELAGTAETKHYRRRGVSRIYGDTPAWALRRIAVLLDLDEVEAWVRRMKFERAVSTGVDGGEDVRCVIGGDRNLGSGHWLDGGVAGEFANDAADDEGIGVLGADEAREKGEGENQRGDSAHGGPLLKISDGENGYTLSVLPGGTA
jgi:hypothetical protein